MAPVSLLGAVATIYRCGYCCCNFFPFFWHQRCMSVAIARRGCVTSCMYIVWILPVFDRFLFFSIRSFVCYTAAAAVAYCSLLSRVFVCVFMLFFIRYVHVRAFFLFLVATLPHAYISRCQEWLFYSLSCVPLFLNTLAIHIPLSILCSYASCMHTVHIWRVKIAFSIRFHMRRQRLRWRRRKQQQTMLTSLKHLKELRTPNVY